MELISPLGISPSGLPPWIPAPEGGEVLLHEEPIREDVVDDFAGDLHVAAPKQPVALGAVVDVLLHPQVRRVGPRVPDLREERVGTVERALVPNGVINMVHDHFAENERRVAEERQADVTEGAVGGGLGRPRPSGVNRCGPPQGAFRHSSRDSPVPTWTCATVRAPHLDPPGDLSPEVQHQGGHAVCSRTGQGGLPIGLAPGPVSVLPPVMVPDPGRVSTRTGRRRMSER